MLVSYDCAKLIAELEYDIAEFGKYATCYGVYVKRDVKVPFREQALNVEFMVNYLLGGDEPSPEESEGGRVQRMTLAEAHEIFESQNEGIEYDVRL